MKAYKLQQTLDSKICCQVWYIPNDNENKKNETNIVISPGKLDKKLQATPK